MYRNKLNVEHLLGFVFPVTALITFPEHDKTSLTLQARCCQAYTSIKKSYLQQHVSVFIIAVRFEN